MAAMVPRGQGRGSTHLQHPGVAGPPVRGLVVDVDERRLAVHAPAGGERLNFKQLTVGPLAESPGTTGLRALHLQKSCLGSLESTPSLSSYMYWRGTLDRG